MRLPYDKDRAFSIRIGTYKGETAIGALGAFRLSTDPDVTLDFGGAFGIEHSQKGVTAGITWSW